MISWRNENNVDNRRLSGHYGRFVKSLIVNHLARFREVLVSICSERNPRGIKGIKDRRGTAGSRAALPEEQTFELALGRWA
jgi:hypothetical protein